jgi:hypothetical protein
LSTYRELQRLGELRAEMIELHESAMAKLAATHLHAVAAGHYELARDADEALATLWASREDNPDLFREDTECH